MDRDDLLSALDDLLDDAGLPGGSEQFLEQLTAYARAMHLDRSAESILRIATSVVAGQKRKEIRQPLDHWADKRLLGHLQPAYCAMRRASGASPREFKAAFPSLWPRVKSYVGSKRIDRRLLRAAPGRDWNIFCGRWKGDERVAPSLPGYVLALGMSTSFLGDDQGVCEMIRRLSEESGHPSLPSMPFYDNDDTWLTAGWARVAWESGSDGLVIEEIQSDWFAAKHQLHQFASMHPDAREHLPIDFDVTAEVVQRVTDALPHLQEDLMAAVFCWGCDKGVSRYWMPGFEARSAVSGLGAPPRSVYEDLPRRFGMRPERRPFGIVIHPSAAGMRLWNIDL